MPLLTVSGFGKNFLWRLIEFVRFEMLVLMGNWKLIKTLNCQCLRDSVEKYLETHSK